jgi:eukaryotic-like serine/threonine-protein kinase
VYRAYDPALDTDVALKVLADHHSSDPEMRERFIREARLLRRFHSDRLVTVHDIGEWRGQPYLVMELVPNGTLVGRIGDAPATKSEVVHLVRELGACLAAVHEGGVVHRDVKPSNLLIRSVGGTTSDAQPVLLADGERLVLADFGLARDVDNTALTVSGGTDGFMAPEQRVPSATIDQRADLYAATAIVAHAALGTSLTRSGRLDEVIKTADIDAPLRTALRQGLAGSPDDRFGDSGEWTKAMLDGLTARAIDPAHPARQRRSPLTLAAVAAMLIAIVVGTALALRNRSSGNDGRPGVTTPSAAATGPQIIGPDTLLIGEPGTYLHEDRAGVTYTWTDPAGVKSTAPSIKVTPAGPDDLVVKLTENDQGVERTSTLTIRVRTR